MNQPQSGRIITVGNYAISAIYYNTMKADGTPAKRPWYNVVLSDGGKFPCFTHKAISHLIGPQEQNRQFNPPVMAELYIEARPLPSGPIIVPKPPVSQAPALVAPGQPVQVAAPAPVYTPPAPAATVVQPGQVVPKNLAQPPAGAVLAAPESEDPLDDAVYGPSAPPPGEIAGGAVRQAVQPPAPAPVVKPGAQPPAPGLSVADVRDAELRYRMAHDAITARSIAVNSAWQIVCNVMAQKALNLDECLGRIRESKLNDVVHLIANDILDFATNEAPF